MNLSQELKRMELLANSPIISSVVELYNGLTIFRLYDKVNHQRKAYQKSVDEVISIFMHSRYTLFFIYIWNGTIMNLFILISFLVICSAKKFKWSSIPQDINYLSVTLNWILIIPNFIEFVLFYYVYFSQSMSSVERMLFNVDKETCEGLRRKKSKTNFHHELGIEVQNIYSRYRENLPFVLKGISLNIEKGQKVAIVGRTGSGKSSFLLALTRIINIQNSRNFRKIKKLQKIRDPEK